MSEIPADILETTNKLVNHYVNPYEPRPDCRPDFRPYLRKLIAEALAAERQRDRWQPIETAPKDGTKVDIGELNRWGWERVTDAHWDAPRGFWVHWGMSSLDRMDNVTVSIIPTHWMPLPPPPHNTNTK